MSNQYEFITINPLLATREELELEIKKLKHESDILKNMDVAFKLILNSTYGAIANKWFVAHNPDVAEAVTLQGQDLIKFSEKVITRYFHELWHKDIELHKKLGVTNVKQVTGPVTIYGDTDSNYCAFGEIYNSVEDFKGDGKEFVFAIYENRLKDYLNKCFEKYGEKYETKNIQNFELETISESAIFLAKKKYILNLIWSDPVDLEPLKNLKYTGVEIKQSSTPLFARKKLEEFIKYFFIKKASNFNLQEFISLLKKCKEEFKLQNIDDIAMGSSLSDYPKHILNDTTAFEINSGCPFHTRGAGLFNYKLNNSKWKGKYELIRSGEKIKYYYAIDKLDPDNNSFSYKPGNFPTEFAPEVDYDMQFTKAILDPLNRIVVAMGFSAIPSNLVTVRRLF